jgi:hypothetical protein
MAFVLAIVLVSSTTVLATEGQYLGKDCYDIYLYTERTNYFLGDNICVDIMLESDFKFSQASCDILFDPNMLELDYELLNTTVSAYDDSQIDQGILKIWYFTPIIMIFAEFEPITTLANLQFFTKGILGETTISITNAVVNPAGTLSPPFPPVVIGKNLQITISEAPPIYNVYLETVKTNYLLDDFFYVDVMLSGNVNYWQVTAEIITTVFSISYGMNAQHSGAH